MSDINVSTLPRVSAAQLHGLLSSPESAASLAIIDVRDADYLGGHIASSQNLPTYSHDTAIPELVRTLAEKKIVVFHCMLSQQRGPIAALKYARERQRLLRGMPGGGAVSLEPVETERDGQKAAVLEGGAGQKVVVLQGGFEEWVRSGYGSDTKLTEGFVPDLWKGEQY